VASILKAEFCVWSTLAKNATREHVIIVERLVTGREIAGSWVTKMLASPVANLVIWLKIVRHHVLGVKA